MLPDTLRNQTSQMGPAPHLSPPQGISPLQGMSPVQGTLRGAGGCDWLGVCKAFLKKQQLRGDPKGVPSLGLQVHQSPGVDSSAPPLNQTTTLFPKPWKHPEPVTRCQGRCSECLPLCVLGGRGSWGQGTSGVSGVAGQVLL